MIHLLILRPVLNFTLNKILWLQTSSDINCHFTQWRDGSMKQSCRTDSLHSVHKEIAPEVQPPLHWKTPFENRTPWEIKQCRYQGQWEGGTVAKDEAEPLGSGQQRGAQKTHRTCSQGCACSPSATNNASYPLSLALPL